MDEQDLITQETGNYTSPQQDVSVAEAADISTEVPPLAENHLPEEEAEACSSGTSRIFRAAAAFCQKLRAAATPANAMRTAFLLGPVAAYLMVEYLNDTDPFTSHHPGAVALNLVWYLAIFLLFRLIVGRNGSAAAISAGICFCFGLANHYVLRFRGRIIFPTDLLSLRTAANVADQYDYSWNRDTYLAFGILLLYWLLLFIVGRLARQKGRQAMPRPLFAGIAGTLLLWTYVFFATPLLPTIDIWPQQWKTQTNGFLLNFTVALRYSFVEEPEDYSPEEVEEIADAVEQLDAPQPPVTKHPENLIFIMSESFADMTETFPQLELNCDPLAFYHSLEENTIRGTVITPVTGGGTANVEYEVLTGNSLHFLPEGTVAYQLFLYDGIPSLPSQMKELGYYNVAFHPYLSSGWNRTSAYEWLNFDRQMYDTDVEDPHYIRDYISDASDFRELVALTETIDEPSFIFNVTMQNHSGYTQEWTNLSPSVRVIGGAAGSSATTQYFSLLQESDRALEELIRYYSSCEESTMIVFFGDHQPPLGNDFYEELYGKKLDDRTAEEVMQQYAAPFFIWANYDLPEAEDIVISSNYLGVLAAHLAGYELTEYQTMLLELMEALPVCSTAGFLTADGQLYAQAEELPEDVRELYENYRLMAYNHLFDEENHPEDFYE